MLPYRDHNLGTQELVSHLRLISGAYNKASTDSIRGGPVVPFQKKTVYKVINHIGGPSPI